eukprot:CAMPEP_0171833560 /NCGR_PEP_ID=MMETSP0992-20121227/9952_1 /TAXON_ID=483369 /ORGANISM="non described non described, Strain CCMP2098" /LENGTH=96 /DNA_ID=CAMNT_0012449199 /DNA_START=1159 /DNA_END=1449 /DNA_ORIENTATION=+
MRKESERLTHMGRADLWGVKVVAQCYDIKSWCRQSSMRRLDDCRWWWERYYDERVTMGCAFSTDIAQRISLIMLAILDGQWRFGCPIIQAGQDQTM